MAELRAPGVLSAAAQDAPAGEREAVATTAVPEGVVVLGMHRSGTSLITRLVNLLGISVCRYGDLLVGRARNPRGHWESKSLVHYNDRLLEELGGSWFNPPPMGPEETAKLLAEHGAQALAAVQNAHPQRPWVWKDPRTCALMPFWAAVLQGRVVYLLAVRHPYEVSDSLATRNGCTPLLSLAMWERYTRQAMLGAAGSPAIACTYDGVLADPVAWCERVAAFLGELGLAIPAVDRLAVEAFVMNELRHSSRAWSDLEPGASISSEQVALAQAASQPTMQRVYAPPPLPPETPRTTEIFAEITALRPGSLGLSALPSRYVTPVSPARNAREAAWPPVSAILACEEPAAVGRALAALESLPAGSELLVRGAGREAAGAWCERHGIEPRVIEGEPGGQAATLALGAQQAGGRLVLLTSGRLLRCDGWYLPLRQVLANGEVGGAAPALRFRDGPRGGSYGRVLLDADLTTGPRRGRVDDGPVSVSLLPGTHCLFIRRVFAAAGGLDGEFSSIGGALAELSVRLWRMGFRCSVHPKVQALATDPGAEDAPDEVGRLHDRLRLATLHLKERPLRELIERVSALPAYGQAAQRLADSDTEHRRAAIEAVCALSIDWYFESFPVGHSGPAQTPVAVQRRKMGTIERIRRRARRR